MDKNYFLNLFQKYDTEELLLQRAKGDDLLDPAHDAIEELLNERQVTYPARPKRAVRHADEPRKGDALLQVSLVIVLMIVSSMLVNIMKANLGVSMFIYALAFTICMRFRSKGRAAATQPSSAETPLRSR